MNVSHGIWGRAELPDRKSDDSSIELRSGE